MKFQDHFFASCPRGLEGVLSEELQKLSAGNIQMHEGGVAFSGTFRTMRAVNLHSRIASRVLWQVARGLVRQENDAYRLARAVDWRLLFSVEHSIKVQTTAIKSSLRSIDFVSLKIKDAICDHFREHEQKRPNVDTQAPDMRIFLFLRGEDATLYLDTSGEALFKRGWRVHTREAPIRENLAAGLLALSGWTPEEPLLDPMCGSGTFLIEAAEIALNRAAGRRRTFAFEKFQGMDLDAWAQEKQAAIAAEQALQKLAIFGFDADKKAILAAQDNVQSAELEGAISLQIGAIPDISPKLNRGILISNPPYGVRLDELEHLAAFYPVLGSWLKRECAGMTAFLLTADPALMRGVRLAPKRKTPIFNGALECRFLKFPMVAGSNR